MTLETLQEANRLTRLIEKADDLMKVIAQYADCAPEDGIKAAVFIVGEGWHSQTEIPVNWLAGLYPSLRGTKTLLEEQLYKL
jgi:hypothetical protein